MVKNALIWLACIFGLAALLLISLQKPITAASAGYPYADQVSPAFQAATQTATQADEPRAAPTPRPPYERNPGLVAGGVIIVLIILLGVFIYARRH
ncbi:MAG: hypothetical protein EHM70_08135 [Chloroflexota bacterium]|nr:MAG: hypothetical protein EHM70_08135 [Chloroflexota bacterium]